MEITTKSAAVQPSPYQPAALERTPRSRSGRFAQMLNDVSNQAAKKSAVAASATLGNLAQPRSTRFMDNMNIEQRRSIVEDKDFVPVPAAMESTRRTFK
ncbi:hypothetical protein [Pseudomonas syringae]|uniref:hypothetical protein n=1 Tax=Pseudomonas syringae TaxID=317 RepID=UPI003F74B9BE